ncbi:hypothetical protein [Pedobacter psychroterrae]|uniref:Oxygen tolerance protein BatD n=1 Tax=Pedobacter psychroterrae TaxID=2530453 RepID=A0A4V2ML75_9SPHI|nr:hypothetical protein [Pedobacter psychroterrae]TCD01017.1 hypothetical protein EZ437_09595 [Pedobacter psychroterrae]
MRKYLNFSYCLLLALLCFAYQSRAQDIKVSAKLDKTTIALGDQTILRLSVVSPLKMLVTFPVLADTLSSKVQLVETGKIDTLVDQNNPSVHTLNRQYTITSFEAGLHMIPALAFETKDGKLTTEALPLEVNAVKVDTTKAIYDIKQPLTVSYSFMDWLKDNWYWVLSGIAALLLLAGLAYYLKKRKIITPEVQRAKEPEVPLHVSTVNRLNALREKKLWQMDLVKEYYVELSDILREYLEKRYGVKALEQTSDEIFASTRQLEIGEQSRNQLRQILIIADLVKFAKGIPQSSDNEQSMENAVSFVMATKEAARVTDNKANDELV